jgi:hypothetical protein
MNETLRKKVEERAYELFVKRGGAHGYHMEDWTRAEKELTAEAAKPVPKAAALKPATPIAPKKPQQNYQKRKY